MPVAHRGAAPKPILDGHTGATRQSEVLCQAPESQCFQQTWVHGQLCRPARWKPWRWQSHDSDCLTGQHKDMTMGCSLRHKNRPSAITREGMMRSKALQPYAFAFRHSEKACSEIQAGKQMFSPAESRRKPRSCHRLCTPVQILFLSC